MKTVYSAPHLSLVSIVQNILDQHGISCWIKNEFLSSGVGDLPPIECWPQLSVEDDDFEAAQEIVDAALTETAGPAWICASCGETQEGQFTDCWKCGTARHCTEQVLHEDIH